MFFYLVNYYLLLIGIISKMSYKEWNHSCAIAIDKALNQVLHPEIIHYIKKYNVVIFGSFILQVVLGEKWSKDIDMYYPIRDEDKLYRSVIRSGGSATQFGKVLMKHCQYPSGNYQINDPTNHNGLSEYSRYFDRDLASIHTFIVNGNEYQIDLCALYKKTIDEIWGFHLENSDLTICHNIFYYDKTGLPNVRMKYPLDIIQKKTGVSFGREPSLTLRRCVKYAKRGISIINYKIIPLASPHEYDVLECEVCDVNFNYLVEYITHNILYKQLCKYNKEFSQNEKNQLFEKLKTNLLMLPREMLYIIDGYTEKIKYQSFCSSSINYTSDKCNICTHYFNGEPGKKYKRTLNYILSEVNEYQIDRYIIDESDKSLKQWKEENEKNQKSYEKYIRVSSVRKDQKKIDDELIKEIEKDRKLVFDYIEYLKNTS